MAFCLGAVSTCTYPGRSSKQLGNASAMSEDQPLLVRQITREELARQEVISEGVFRSDQIAVMSDVDSVAALIDRDPAFLDLLEDHVGLASMNIDCNSPLSLNKCFDCAASDTSIYILTIDSKRAAARLIIGVIVLQPSSQHNVEIPVYILQGLFDRPRLKQETFAHILDIEVFGFKAGRLVTKSLLVL